MKSATLLLLLLLSSGLFAGPPFIIDDSSSVDYKQQYYNLFSAFDKTDANQLVVLPAFEFDYGLAPNWDVTTVVPLIFQTSNEPNTHHSQGMGDIQFGFKYAFLLETADRPQIAFAPLYFIPTGKVNQELGNGKSQLLLPLWVQKSWNSWTSYGGGGYFLNNAREMKSSYLGGAVLQRQINEKFMLGGEIFSQGATANDTSPFVLLNLGGSYQLTPSITTQISVGHTLIGMQHFVGYLGFVLMV